MQCPQCSAAVEAGRVYCSALCRNRARRSRENKDRVGTCRVCSSEFTYRSRHIRAVCDECLKPIVTEPPKPEPEVVAVRPVQVYFLLGRLTQRLKVGISSQFDLRLKGMQNQNFDDITVLGLLPGDEALEREIHRELGSFHSHNEFFDYTDEVKAVVDKYLHPEGTLEGDPVSSEAGSAPRHSEHTTC
jgi:hypothetical protein